MLLHVLYIHVVPILLDHMTFVTKVGVFYVDHMNDDGAGIVLCHW